MILPNDFHRLPPVERDVLYLHQILQKPQTEVAKILGVSQPTVNYRFKRAKARLAFLEQLPRVSSNEVREVLHRLGAREQDIEAMVLYLETNSQSEVARRMETSQGAVRYWVMRALTEHLQKDMREDGVHKRVRTACSMLISKPGIFNEPQKARQADKYKHAQRSLNTAPKTDQVGSRVFIRSGLYRDLEGELLVDEDNLRSVRITLESQEITLSWSS